MPNTQEAQEEIETLEKIIQTAEADLVAGRSVYGESIGRQHVAGLKARKQALMIKLASKQRQPMPGFAFGSNP